MKQRNQRTKGRHKMNQDALLMLKQVTHSKNEQCAKDAKAVLTGEISPAEMRRYAGSFFRAVLDGNRNLAYFSADSQNKRALESNPYTHTQTVTV